MFGYVLPVPKRLSEEEDKRYRAAYCGLCRSLHQEYGFRARFLVNYDMTFLYFLLCRQAPCQPENCFCPARIFCRKACLPNTGEMIYAADMSVLFSYWKLRDAVRDGRFFHRLAARLGLRFYRRAYRKACDRHPQTDEIFARELQRLQQLEDTCCSSIDRTADAFAQLLKACAAPVMDMAERRATELLLYHVGRYLYLADAFEDLPRDLKNGSYNPLRYRFTLTGDALGQEDREMLIETMEASISMAASALELLPERADAPILRNIVYYGLPGVLHSIAAGTFRKRGKNP